MKTDNLNFVMVNNNLLSNTTLSSTQKLFISFILGWQRSELTCRMTNRNLASHFGMKYAGIRSLLNKLNKLDFFETTQFGHAVENSNWTSGHEMKVDEAKLIEFLKPKKLQELPVDHQPAPDVIIEKQADLIKAEEATNLLEEILQADEVGNNIEAEADEIIFEISQTEEKDVYIGEHENITKYNDDDLIDITEIMTDLNFNQEDIKHFIQRFRSNKVIFEDFASYYTGLVMAKEREEHYFGVEISKEQEEKLKRMIVN
ncbi:hypothetical protein D3C85_244290 [compost metagenome]